MTLISAQDISVSFGTGDVLSGVTLVAASN